jgi:hypothetical protein
VSRIMNMDLVAIISWRVWRVSFQSGTRAAEGRLRTFDGASLLLCLVDAGTGGE